MNRHIISSRFMKRSKESSIAIQNSLSAMSPVDLGTWFHTGMKKLIAEKSESELNQVLPRRHQPHNRKGTSNTNIALSIENLIKLCEQFSLLELSEAKKQFYRSKAVAILMKSPKEGGCHACGGLTSQTLLYSLSCLGLIPIAASCWGELVGTETAGYLVDRYGLSYSEGRAEQFLTCCVAASGTLTKEQIENRICKWTRYLKHQQRQQESTTGNIAKITFRDAIFPGQKIYHPKNGLLDVVTILGNCQITPPASHWINPRGKRLAVATVFWEQHTKSNVFWEGIVYPEKWKKKKFYR
jgi:hypothetical protein